MLRIFAWCYATVVLIAGCYAWVGDIVLRNSDREHLLGDMLLALVTMPSSLVAELLYPVAPPFFDKPFVLLAITSVLGTLQVAILFWLARVAHKVFRSTPNSRWSGP
jgi:hypothetical protein